MCHSDLYICMVLIQLQVDYPTRAITVRKSNLIGSKEFAEQIDHLHRMRESNSTLKYVTQWLIWAVSDRDSEAVTDFPTVSKKMRDQPSKGFCRSGLWIAVKVFLQLSLTIALGKSDGKCIYKLIMLRFMSKMADQLKISTFAKDFDYADTAIEINAKMARRIEKLPGVSKDSAFAQSVSALTSQVTSESKKIITSIKDDLQERHIEMQRSIGDKCNLHTSTPMASDTKHKLSPEFINYLNEREAKVVLKQEKIEFDEECNETFEFDSKAPPDIHQLKELSNNDEIHRCLNDIEKWVLEQLDELSDNTSPIYLRDLAIEYRAKALDFYAPLRKDGKVYCRKTVNPIEYSKMVLTILKLIQVSHVGS